MDFGALPPEVNSGRMYCGPGSAPMVAAASAWNGLAAELSVAAVGYERVITTLQTEEWLGLHRCPAGDPGRRAVAAVRQWRVPVCDDVLPSRTCRCGVGRQLRRGHRSGLVSELRLLLHRANAFRPRRRRPRSGRFPPTQSRRRARTRPAADGSATADLHPAALCRSVGDWGVHTRHDKPGHQNLA